MGANILVVDDSITFLKIIQGILESEGHTVITCSDGREIFNMLNEHTIDVILLDVIMPDITGFDLLAMLSESEEYRNIPVLLVTGLGHPEDVKRGLELGAIDYIKKPCEKIEIIARVHSALRLKEKQDQLVELATTDGLTQVHNRTYIDRKLVQIMSRLSTMSKGIAFMMVDIDHLKHINDVYGHMSGDSVLSGVAGTIRRTVKNMDVVGRFGGGSFCVIFLDTNMEGAHLAAERVRTNIENMKFNLDWDPVKVTVSIGISHFEQQSTLSIDELVHRASDAMIRAKEKGRNRTELYE